MVTALASFCYKPLPHLQTTWLVLVLSNFRLCFWGVNFPFSLPIDLTSETCVVSRATLCTGTALQQPASCLADAQGQLTGDNQVLSGKMQGAWQSPVRSLLGSRCSHQVEENNIQAQNCMIFFFLSIRQAAYSSMQKFADKKFQSQNIFQVKIPSSANFVAFSLTDIWLLASSSTNCCLLHSG